MKVKILVVGIQITQERQRRIVEMIASKITDVQEKQRLGRDRLLKFCLYPYMAGHAFLPTEFVQDAAVAIVSHTQ